MVTAEGRGIVAGLHAFWLCHCCLLCTLTSEPDEEMGAVCPEGAEVRSGYGDHTFAGQCTKVHRTCGGRPGAAAYDQQGPRGE